MTPVARAVSSHQKITVNFCASARRAWDTQTEERGVSKRRLAARHTHTAGAAMFVVTSLRRPIKCPLLIPRTSKRTNERTDWKRLNILRIPCLYILYTKLIQWTRMEWLYIQCICAGVHIRICYSVSSTCCTVWRVWRLM